MTANPLLNETAIKWIDQLYKDRLRSLLSIDDIIGAVVEYLTSNDLLNNTYVIYTSDHGYHLGQWRIPCNKEQMYETDIKIPMYIRGPNIPSKSVRNELVGNIDLLPTFVDLADIVFPNASIIDGKSMVGSIIPERVQDGMVNDNVIKDKFNHNDDYGYGYNYDYQGSDLESVVVKGQVNSTKERLVALAKMRGILQVRDSKEKKIGTGSGWRHVYLSQYRSEGTFSFDHCETWWIGNSTGIDDDDGYNNVYGFPGIVIDPPGSNYQGLDWYIDNKTTNNWRMLRIINSTDNIAYGEFIDYKWEQESKKNPMYYELYDMNNDFYQMNNLYPIYSKNNSMKGYLKQLHDLLMQLGDCTGSSCFV